VHRAGVVHRDFKPENVLVGEDGRPRVSDFGLASLRTEPGAAGGTHGYMAPEQLAGALADHRSDQYAFCVTLWEALHGLRPDPGGDPSRGRRAVPRSVDRVVRRGLAMRPEDRWPSMDALLAALRRPRWYRRRGALGSLAVACVTVIALVIVRAVRSDEPPRAMRLVKITHRGDLRNAQLSRDGTQLAFVAGDALVIRRIDRDDGDRVVVEYGVDPRSLSWSPDGRSLVATVPDVPSRIRTEVIDAERGTRTRVPLSGMATFLSSTELAVTSYRRHWVEILPIGAPAAIARCEVPGDYTFIQGVIRVSDDTFAVRTSTDKLGGLVMLGRDCQVLASYREEGLSSAASTDGETLVALVDHDGYSELVELTLHGAVRSRRMASGELQYVLGRRHGVDYAVVAAARTHLFRVVGMATPVQQFSTMGGATYTLDPRGETLAWIEFGTRPHGPLRLATLRGLAARGRPLLDHARATAWSPDGKSLATLVKDDDRVAIVVTDRTGSHRRRLPLQDLDSSTAPVWLTDHRVAALSRDDANYLWFDLDTGDHGALLDRVFGGIGWLARSPRDGTLAFWATGRPGATGQDAEHVWLIAPGHEPAPLVLGDVGNEPMVPTWSARGDLLLYAFQTGVVSRVAREAGQLTPIARLAPSPFPEELMELPDGSLLATRHELDLDLAALDPG
jgi:hypothetical protein